MHFQVTFRNISESTYIYIFHGVLFLSALILFVACTLGQDSKSKILSKSKNTCNQNISKLGKSLFCQIHKVQQMFWEGHISLKKSPTLFWLCEIFFQILWSSQNIWLLLVHLKTKMTIKMNTLWGFRSKKVGTVQ